MATYSHEGYARDFGPFNDHVWLNCAHQGPLSRPAAEAIRNALYAKISPHRMRDSDFVEVPRRLKSALGRLIGVPAEQVILGNSTAYGLNVLVQGLPLEPGDEVLLVDGDFPSTVITWLPLREKGIDVRLFRPRTWPPTAEDLQDQLRPRTRVFCCSWVFSFFGHAVDLHELGATCRQRNVLFVVNGSQALGARPIDVMGLPVDALVGCGFKWLCGPYGTGFAWIRPDILDSLRYKQAYWLAHGGSRSADYSLRDDVGAAAYDVFGTANFLNFQGWTASVEYLLRKEIGTIEEYDQNLIQHSVDSLIEAGMNVNSPIEGDERSTLIVFSHRDPAQNGEIYRRLTDAGVHIAEREGRLRISPHLYNTTDDIDSALTIIRAVE